MVRKDYENGGFPVSTQNPVYCITAEGQVFIASDSTHLSHTLQARQDFTKVFGVWPGKNNTDTFVLNIEKYKEVL